MFSNGLKTSENRTEDTQNNFGQRRKLSCHSVLFWPGSLLVLNEKMQFPQFSPAQCCRL